MAVFVSVQKEEELRRKTKTLSQFLKSHISGMLEAISLKFCMGVLKLVGVSTAKFVLFRKGSTELQRCENCIFFLPVNILTVSHAGFLATQLTSVLITILYFTCISIW